MKHPQSKSKRAEPSLDPYIGKQLERFELFQTNQCYYLIGCNRTNTQYRVLTFDRTLIERPAVVNVEQQSTTSTKNNHAAAGMTTSPTIQRSHSNNSNLSSSDNNNNHNNNNSTENNNNSSNSFYQQQHQANMAAAEQSHNAKPTLRPLSDFLREDDHVYTQEEIKELLDVVHDGNRLDEQINNNNYNHANNSNTNTNPSATAAATTASTAASGVGGLKPIVRAYGIVGFIRFLDCYYLTLITRRTKVGSIGGNGVYTIKGTESFPLKPRGALSSVDQDHQPNQADPSSVLLSMWNRGKRQIGLGLSGREIAELRYQGLFQVINLQQNFFFSYTYDLTRSLQENFLATSSQPFPPPSFKDMYAWNYFLTRELEECLHSLTSYHWVMPIIHGAFVQRKLHDYGRSLNLILVARRSRHFAGTRYLKRGVNEQGKVANDVEHEQILHDESNSTCAGIFSAYLQVRGSIPTFWTQESSMTMPKPPIELNRVDPTYTATQLHFQDLFTRYGSPICVWDLVKQSEKREREVRVGNEFRHGIDYINTSIDDDHKIR
jgi:SacI homology domain